MEEIVEEIVRISSVLRNHKSGQRHDPVHELLVGDGVHKGEGCGKRGCASKSFKLNGRHAATYYMSSKLQRATG